MPDPRHPKGRRHPLPAMLSLIALGLLMGARDVYSIWTKVGGLSESQREAIGLRVRHKVSRRLKMPGYDALNDLLAAIDPVEYARALTAWLQANAGVLPRSLALDGKFVADGRCGLIVTLCDHENGRPVAMIPATGKKEDAEVAAARELLSDPQMSLVNARVTAHAILEKGGELPRGHQGKHPQAAQSRATRPGGLPLFELSCEGDHGRIDTRSAAVEAISPVDAGLPGARSAVTVRRQWSEKKNPEVSKTHTRFFLTSLNPEDKTRSVQAVRGHWSIENRNHHKHDTSPWQEDRHRHRRPNLCKRRFLLQFIDQSYFQNEWRFFAPFPVEGFRFNASFF